DVSLAGSERGAGYEVRPHPARRAARRAREFRPNGGHRGIVWLSSRSAFWHDGITEQRTCSHRGGTERVMKLRDWLTLAAIVGSLALIFVITRVCQTQRGKPGSPECGT